MRVLGGAFPPTITSPTPLRGGATWQSTVRLRREVATTPKRERRRKRRVEGRSLRAASRGAAPLIRDLSGQQAPPPPPPPCWPGALARFSMGPAASAWKTEAQAPAQRVVQHPVLDRECTCCPEARTLQGGGGF